MIKIEIWSDYVCPFCYIGKRQLEMAIKSAGLQEHVEIQMKAYQLDPSTRNDDSRSVVEYLAEKYNISLDQAKQNTEGVAARAKEVGLNFNFENMQTSNTFKAHRLAKWAEMNGQGAAFSEAVLQAYFIETKKISDNDVLIEIVEQLGLSTSEALSIINSNDFDGEVRQEIQEAMQLGVRGVPFFVLDRKYGISGAQPQQYFEDTLRRAAKEAGIQSELKIAVDEETNLCTDDACEI